MSTIRGRVTAITSDGFTVELLELTGAASAQLASRAAGSGDSTAWTSHGAVLDTVGQTRAVSGLTTGASREWRLQGPAGEDGQHGLATPAASIWATLTDTVASALEGQGMLAASIYVGVQPETNYSDAVAILRTRPERYGGRSTNASERVLFPVEVEVRCKVTDDTGGTLKATIDTWQRRIEAALHEKHAGDFPGLPGLEAIRVEVAAKDDATASDDEYRDELRARAVVLFAIWRAK